MTAIAGEIGFAWAPAYHVAMGSEGAAGDRLPGGRARVDTAQVPVPPGAEASPEDVAAWDRACVEQARSGFTAAFGALAECYAARVYNHVYRFVRNREEAEDVTQEVFIRAYAHLGAYDADRPFRNWLYAIATRLALNAVRSRRRRAHLENRAAPAAERAANQDGPVAEEELRDRVNAAVDELDARDAALLRLHYREGLTLKDVAGALGITEGAARTAAHRARKRLREQLMDEELW